MRDRSEQILRLLCLALVALLVVQLVHAFFRGNPLAHVTVPAIPTLETNTAAPSKPEAEKKPAPSAKAASTPETNAVAKAEPHVNKTNSVSTTNTAVTVAETSTNVASTNQSQADSSTSNIVTVLLATTNLASATTNQSTNHSVEKGTNAITTVASAKHSEKHGHSMPPGMAIPGGVHFTGGPMPMMPGMHGPGPKLSPDIQARVDEIVNSEILAPVMHPLPMGLLGIAGDYAFLRADSGQTGVVQVGEKVGDLKLLRIGINRVLIEQDGKQKELTIFNGYGGESLMNQTNEISK